VWQIAAASETAAAQKEAIAANRLYPYLLMAAAKFLDDLEAELRQL
jgi:hypothetical protein